MIVAITGANGFIGKHLTQRLTEQGHTVIKVPRGVIKRVTCDRIYHLACPSTTKFMTEHPLNLAKIIVNGTIHAMELSQTALFVNASSFGAADIDINSDTPQQIYNTAKRLMEIYLSLSNRPCKNYRLPSIYGEGMSDDSFIKRCLDKKAYRPLDPDKLYYISHIDDVVESLINLTDVNKEEITLGQIYEEFNSGRRGLHRPTFNTEITGQG